MWSLPGAASTTTSSGCIDPLKLGDPQMRKFESSATPVRSVEEKALSVAARAMTRFLIVDLRVLLRGSTISSHHIDFTTLQRTGPRQDPSKRDLPPWVVNEAMPLTVNDTCVCPITPALEQTYEIKRTAPDFFEAWGGIHVRPWSEPSAV